MSTEYYFYLGYRDNKTGKYGILGPYANNGEYKYILCRSQSFVSDLYESFRRLSPDDLDDSIKEDFTYKSLLSNNKEKLSNLYTLDFDELPTGSYIKNGYYLIEDVHNYIDNQYSASDLFYDKIESSIEYSERLKNELILGAPTPTTDDYGNEYTPRSIRDYMYFSYPDYNCEEYEANVFRNMKNILYNEYDEDTKDITPVCLIKIY